MGSQKLPPAERQLFVCDKTTVLLGQQHPCSAAVVTCSLNDSSNLHHSSLNSHAQQIPQHRALYMLDFKQCPTSYNCTGNAKATA